MEESPERVHENQLGEINLLARGASDELWPNGLVAPDRFAKSKCIWLVRGPLFLRGANAIVAAGHLSDFLRIGTAPPHTGPGPML